MISSVIDDQDGQPDIPADVEFYLTQLENNAIRPTEEEVEIYIR